MPPLFPYTTLFRSVVSGAGRVVSARAFVVSARVVSGAGRTTGGRGLGRAGGGAGGATGVGAGGGGSVTVPPPPVRVVPTWRNSTGCRNAVATGTPCRLAGAKRRPVAPASAAESSAG